MAFVQPDAIARAVPIVAVIQFGYWNAVHTDDTE